MNVEQAVNERFSSRYLMLDKKISQENLNIIMQAGLKAPSGFSTEPWKFYVVENKQDEFFEATYHQPHVKTAPYIVVVTYKTEKYVDQNPEFLVDKFTASGFTPDKVEMYVNTLKARGMNQYFKEQCLFAVSQMVLQATSLGLATCVMGGFVESKVLDIIGVDSELENVSVIFSLGYSSTEKRERKTRSFEEVVEFIK